jgi:PAS domain S-box-containing protein
LTLLVPPLRQQFKFLLFFIAVFASATGGIGPGVFATLLSVAMADYFLIPPFHSFAVSDPLNLVPLLLFCAVGFVTVWIVNRKQRLEETLRTAAAVIESSADSIMRLSLDNTILSWNKAAEHIYGYTAEEAIGRPASLIVPLDHREELQRLVERVHQRGSVKSHETVCIRKDGAHIHVALTLSPVQDRQGKIVGMSGIARDITERKRAEEALRQSEQINREVIAGAREGVIVYDRDFCYRIWNPAMEELTGQPASQVLGKRAFDMFPHLREQKLDVLLERALAGETVQSSDALFQVEQTGKSGWVSAMYSPHYGPNSEIIGVIGLVRDISDRKQAEEEMRKAKEAAEAASRAKSEFLAVMSHEIRTPMNGIIGMTDLTLDTHLSREQRDYLTMVKESAGTLLTMINDILDFSKIEAGRLSLDISEFDLQDTLSYTMRALAPRADEKGLELTWETLPGLPPRVVGDPGRLRQILVNLVGNAIKFTERGEVDLRVDIDSQGEDGVALHFCVTDTGIGIPREEQQRIFEAFVQADSSTTRKYGGTGLGLAISSRLVKLMEGRIWVESEPNKGSRFHFTAKFGLVKGPQPQPAALAEVNLQDAPVLVIDDNATNRRILETMLKGWSMAPTLVGRGNEGLAAMRLAKEMGKPFPLILLDAQMPGMDGFIVMEKLKEDPTLVGTAIMMLTSAGLRGDAARCRELGISAYLVKPIRQSELLEAILLVLGQSSPGKDHAHLVTRHTIREARRKVRILVAEDNARARDAPASEARPHSHGSHERSRSCRPVG